MILLISKKKRDLDDKLKNLDQNVASNKTKHALVENELKKISKNLKQYQNRAKQRFGKWI